MSYMSRLHAEMRISYDRIWMDQTKNPVHDGDKENARWYIKWALKAKGVGERTFFKYELKLRDAWKIQDLRDLAIEAREKCGCDLP